MDDRRNYTLVRHVVYFLNDALFYGIVLYPILRINRVNIVRVVQVVCFVYRKVLEFLKLLSLSAFNAFRASSKNENIICLNKDIIR
jgi:hypothetical protein